MKKDFSRITFHSKLFKGRADWYFCYLKAEKIAHVCGLISSRATPDATSPLQDIEHASVRIVENVIYTAAGELPEEVLLADLFLMLSKLRLGVSSGHISKETAKILSDEYEGIVERIVGDSRHLGLSLSPQDLAVPAVTEEPFFTPLPSLSAGPIKDIKDMRKGHSVAGERKDGESQAQKGQGRAVLILDFVQKNKGVSIKDISMVIRDCSEKTIQRELNMMIERGIIARQGERRWSTYHPVKAA